MVGLIRRLHFSLIRHKRKVVGLKNVRFAAFGIVIISEVVLLPNRIGVVHSIRDTA